jgi:tRNA pseudouridine32 synthase/23S rRNA pseudouridine746 synthase
MMTETLALIHVDDALIAVDKPAGLLAVPGRGADKQDCLAVRVCAEYPEARVVHRLDMATSGLMLMARVAVAQRLLSQAFARRQVHKEYVAVVAGRVVEPRGRIDLPIGADWPNRPLQQVDRLHGRTALTDWRVLGFDAAHDTSRLALQPLTGRTHQLRVHLHAIGHPILGDALYAPAAVRDSADRLLLHAQALELLHPVSGDTLRLRCEAPF